MLVKRWWERSSVETDFTGNEKDGAFKNANKMLNRCK